MFSPQHSVDIDGINLLAIQALEKRTREWVQVKEELATMKRENAALKAQMAAFESTLQRLEAMMAAVEQNDQNVATVAEVTP